MEDIPINAVDPPNCHDTVWLGRNVGPCVAAQRIVNMTIFHVIALCLCAIVTITVARIFHPEIYAAGTFVVAAALLTWWMVLTWRRRHVFPMCQNPACKRRRFKAIGFARDLNIADSGVVIECPQCGERYLHSPERIMALAAGNQPIRYMKRVPGSTKWEADA